MFLDDTACNLASLNLMRSARERASFDVEAYEHAVRLWTVVLEISVLMAQFPSQEIANSPTTTARSGLGYANIGGLLMSPGIGPTIPRRPRHLRRAHRDHDRRVLRHLGRNGGRTRRLPGYDRTPSDMLRVMRNHRRAAYGDKNGYEKLSVTRCRSIHAETAPTANWSSAARQGAVGPRPRTRRRSTAIRNAQVDRDRAHRHHRSRHGLRHDRHRARLRAGEIQEARRRRLFQDHQPAPCRKPCARSAMARRRSPRSRPMRSATARWNQAPGDQSRRRSRPRASPTRRSPRSKGAADGLRHQVRLQQVDARRGEFCKSARLSMRAAERSDFELLPGSASPSRHRGRQHACVRRDDAGRRAAPEAPSTSGVRLRQPVRQASASAISRSRATSA
jgi:hypothetical protein